MTHEEMLEVAAQRESMNAQKRKIEKQFDEWFGELEGYSFRYERFWDDFDYAKESKNNQLMVKWLRTAFEMGKTLEDRIYKWWTTCFTTKCEWSMEECLDDLLDIIELFLPREQSHEGTQNVNTIFAVEAHNELLQKIKSKLRNKKI